MELRQLRYFVTVADELHFGRAAQRLHIAQPAVSQQVSRLERELGVRLLDRSSRRVALTVAGERVLAEARAVLGAADRLSGVAADLSLGAGRVVRIGTGPGLGVRVGRGLDVLSRRVPGIEVRLDRRPVLDQLTAVRRGELDVALARAVTGGAGLRVVELWRDPVDIALPAGHRLARRAAVPLSELPELAELPLRLPDRSCDPLFHDFAVAACRAAGFEPRPGRPAGAPNDTLVEIGTGTPSWTMLLRDDAAAAASRRVAVRPLSPALSVPGCLVVPGGQAASCVAGLADAFGGALNGTIPAGS